MTAYLISCPESSGMRCGWQRVDRCCPFFILETGKVSFAEIVCFINRSFCGELPEVAVGRYCPFLCFIEMNIDSGSFIDFILSCRE